MDFAINNDSSTKNPFDGEIGVFKKFRLEAKNTLFGILFIALKGQETSIYTFAILICIQLLQLLIFPFHPSVYQTWDTYKESDDSEKHPAEVVRAFHSIFNYLNITSYMDDTNWNLYIVILYILLLVLGIFMMNIAYIGFNIYRKRYSFAWAVPIFRYFSILFMTVFFIPFLNYFVSIPACIKDEREMTVHYIYTEIECWTGVHVLHAAFAIIGSIVFVAITGILSLMYYEYKDSPNDSTARVDCNAYLLLLVYKVAMIVCLTFITGDQYQVLLITIMLVGSLIIYFKFAFNTVYHNEVISKMWSMVTGINLWTTSMLAFAKIMQNSTFKGSMAAWLIGIPFIILLTLSSKDHRLNLLLLPENKFQTGEQIRDQIRYVLKLIDWQSSNRNATVLLDGYIEIHKQNCQKDQCPLKHKTIKNNRITKNLMRQNESINERYALLAQLLYKMYLDGVKKFPQNTSLRIAYAFFLLDKMQSKQQALQELLQAEQTQPDIQGQFIIFRYKRIIEDEIVESITEGKNNLDVVNETTFQNTFRQLQANIEKAALLHLEFWSQLAEDNPDLAKLNDVGSKINTAIHNVDETWGRIQKINENNQKALRIYGKFLLEVINDKEAGDKIIEKVRSLSNLRTNRKSIQMIGLVNSENNCDATPTVWVSGEQEKFGVITGINLAAASLFGYSKTELINRKMQILMPEIYGKHHDSLFEHYLNTGEGNLIGKHRERLVFGKNKMGYIFPIYISIRAIQSVIQGIQLIATFRVEKTFKSSAFVVTQPDGTIDSLSSSAISLLKIDNKFLSQRRPNIQDFLPNIVRDRFHFFSSHNSAGKNLALLNYIYPISSEYLLPDEDPKVQLNCQLTEIIFSRMEESVGFHFRFERVQEKPASVQTDKTAKISNFQFRFDRTAPTVVGEYFESSTTTDTQLTPPHYEDVLVGTQIQGQNFSDSEGVQQNSMNTLRENEEVHEKPKIDYGAGIKTLRLYGGRPVEIEDDKSEDNDESVESPQGKESSLSTQLGKNKQGQSPEDDQDSQEEGSYGDFSTTFKSRKALTTMINDKTAPTSILNLRWTVNILVLILLAVGILDYVLAIRKFDEINQHVDLLDKSNERFAEMMTGLARVRLLSLINLGIASGIYDPDEIRSELLEAFSSARSLKQQLEQQTETLSTAHLDLLNDPTISLLSIDGTASIKSLSQATEEIISRAMNLYSTDISSITTTNDDYFFITHNMLNDYYTGLELDARYYSSELSKTVDGKSSIFLIFMIISIAALGFTLLISFPILFQVNKNREEILSLFLDIPEKTVKTLSNKCEIFISNLQVSDGDEIASEIDDEDLEKHRQEKESQDLIPRRKKKKFKNSGKSQKTFYISFLVVALLVEAYFIFIFVYNTVLFNQVSDLVPEFNATSSAERFYAFSNNVERQLFINHSFPILTEDAQEVTTNSIKLMYDLNARILEDHSINRKLHSDDYVILFNQIMNSNPCTLITSTTVDNTACMSFADLTVFQGMTGALSRHFENMRTLLSCFIKIEGGSSCTAEKTPQISVVSDPIQNRVYNLMRTTQSTEMQKMQNIYIRNSFRLLVSQFKQSLKDKLQNALTLNLIILIVFIVCLLTIYSVLWQALAYKIALDVWRTKSMLNMIPLSVIAKIKSIRLFLKKFWNERNLA